MIRNWDWPQPVGDQKTCSMFGGAMIDSPEFTIKSAKDETVTGLFFFANPRVSFLPVKVYESFPNLIGYLANGCSIRKISKENFKNLSKLKMLGLSINQIQTIPSNAFEDLTSLQELYLGELNWFLVLS